MASPRTASLLEKPEDRGGRQLHEESRGDDSEADQHEAPETADNLVVLWEGCDLDVYAL